MHQQGQNADSKNAKLKMMGNLGLNLRWSTRPRVPGRNPNIFQRGEFLSAIFAGDIEDVTIVINEDCETLIQDLLNIKRAEDGTKLKKTVKDKITGQSMEEFGHASDSPLYTKM